MTSVRGWAALGAVLVASAALSQTGSGAHPLFLRGLAALHSFEYEDAHEAFREAQQRDPAFAMAYWGEAMTFHQTLWGNEDSAAGRRALDRLGSSSEARAARASTPLEKGLIGAVELLFAEGDAPTRRRHYAAAMRRLYEENGEDAEVAAFYALALLGTTSRSVIGHDAHEGHATGLAGSDVQRQVGAILNAVLMRHPEHPGALHYLLHNYDDPRHARLGLAAALTLTRLAPDSSHARHMPSHIFLQLGQWRDAASADRAAFDASTVRSRRRNLGPAARNYHALSWLEYSLLQQGKYREAWAVLGELQPVVEATGLVPLISDFASMRARYVVETRRWALMAAESKFANVNDLFAIGMSAARTRNRALAEMARRGLAERALSEREGDLRPAIAIMEQQVAALIELMAGRRDQALQMLRAATDAELRQPPPLGLPEPVKPAPELLGEVLLEIGRPREALEPFEQALARNPNRSLSVLGLARAATALGDTAAARSRYRELLVNFREADADLPEAAEARRAIESAGSPAPQPAHRRRLP